MDKTYAGIQRIHRGIELLLLAVKANAALVRLEHAAQDVHQSGFAGAVFPQQSAYLAGIQAEAHILKDIVCPKGLIDVFHFQVQAITSVFFWYKLEHFSLKNCRRSPGTFLRKKFEPLLQVGYGYKAIAHSRIRL